MRIASDLRATVCATRAAHHGRGRRAGNGFRVSLRPYETSGERFRGGCGHVPDAPRRGSPERPVRQSPILLPPCSTEIVSWETPSRRKCRAGFVFCKENEAGGLSCAARVLAEYPLIALSLRVGVATARRVTNVLLEDRWPGDPAIPLHTSFAAVQSSCCARTRYLESPLAIVGPMHVLIACSVERPKDGHRPVRMMHPPESVGRHSGPIGAISAHLFTSPMPSMANHLSPTCPWDGA